MTHNLQELTQQVKPYLRQYLLDQGVEIVLKGGTEFFKCINPDHPDNDPSNGFVKGSGDAQFHCFSCGSSGDIFTAAHLMEGKPLYGIGFVKDNLEYLLQKYDIEYSIEYTEEQLNSLKIDTIYEEAVKVLTSIDRSTGQFLYIDTKPAQDRGWTTDICRKIGIGTVNSFDQFIDILSKKTKVSREELEQLGIKPSLFGARLITIAIRDHKHVVRGFVSRYIDWKKGSEIPKYCNTAVSENPGYQKDRILFCLNLAKNYNSLKLDIFEGYGSAIVGHQNSYNNCVAIGSTAFTDHHMELIKDLGFQHINFVLDQDSTGSNMMEKYIEKFSGYTNLQVTITNLPFTEEDKKGDGQNDPDYFIRTYGIDKYRKLKPEGLFEHMIRKHSAVLDLNTNPVFTKNFVKQLLPLIINQPDIIERGQMINKLAELTGIDRDDIKNEITRIEKTDIRLIKDEISRKIRNITSPDDLKDLLSKSMDNIIDSGSSKNDRYLSSLTESIEIFDSIFTDMNTQPEGIHGWKTGYQALDNMLDGIPKPIKGGTAIGYASSAQHGKSALLLNLAVNLAKNNNDISVCYWAIDDHRKAIAFRLVSMISGVPMKKVRNTIRRSDEDEKAIREAQDIIRELTSSRKLVFKDDRYGRSKTKAENWLKETQDANGRHILFCVDSLHNVQGEGGSETRVKILSTSMWLKSLCASLPATVMTSIELVKNKIAGVKPNLMAISESGKIEFDFDTIGIVWNEAQGNYTSVDQVSAKWGVPGNYKPVIEVDFQKNKAGAGEKGSLFFKFDSETTAFRDCMSYAEYIGMKQGPSTVISSSGTKYSFESRLDKPKELGLPPVTEW